MNIFSFSVTFHYDDSDTTCVRFSFNVYTLFYAYAHILLPILGYMSVNIARFTLFRYLPYMDAFIKIKYV